MDELIQHLKDYEEILSQRLYSSSSTISDRRLDAEIIRMEHTINQKLNQQIESIEEEAKQSVPNEDEKKQKETELNSRKDQLRRLTEKYYFLKKDYIDRQTRILKKSYLVIHPQANPDELDKINYTDKVVLFDADFELKSLYENIREKHNEFLKLESDLRYLQQLFITANILVKNQGEIIVRVENNVDKVVADTSQGVEQLKQAKKEQKSSRKKMFYISSFLVAIPAIITAVTIAKLKSM